MCSKNLACLCLLFMSVCSPARWAAGNFVFNQAFDAVACRPGYCSYRSHKHTQCLFVLHININILCVGREEGVCWSTLPPLISDTLVTGLDQVRQHSSGAASKARAFWVNNESKQAFKGIVSKAMAFCAANRLRILSHSGGLDTKNPKHFSKTKMFQQNKLTKLGDAIAISKSETVTHSLTHWQVLGARRCYRI